jgi:hypothetical protein
MAKIALPMLAVLTALLCGCGTTSTASPVAPVKATPAAADGSAAHPLTWGQQHTGGTLSVGLGTPAPYTPSRTAFAGRPIERAVVLDITVAVTGGDKAMPAMYLSIQGTAGSAKAETIEDSGNGVGNPMADILPGKSLAWKIAFAVPKDATELTVSSSSLGGGKTIYFTGKL